MAKKQLRHPRRSEWDPDFKDSQVLFHGCTSLDELNIRNNRIDLSLCAPRTDFGRGFYTTTKREQGEDWAKLRVLRSSATPRPTAIVLGFRIRRHALAKLWSLAFVRGERSNPEYWAFVRHCRQNGPGQHAPAFDQFGPSENGWYDLVSGPVAASWQRQLYLLNYDQFSFHTAAGTALLDSAILSGAPDFESYPV
jgi:hypothetical protein